MSSDPYLYPGTDVLRNARGIRDPDDLRRVEADLTATRAARLATHPLPGRYDLAHLQSFHRELFSGLYDWAGELRTVNIAKADLFTPPQFIESYAEEVFGELARAQPQLRTVTQDVFVERLAHHLGNVNALHPFREGNGRTQRAFFSQLAAECGYRLRWGDVAAARNNAAAIASMRGNEQPLRDLLTDIIVKHDP